MKKFLGLLGVLLALLLVGTACTGQSSAIQKKQRTGTDIAKSRQVYVPHNDVEGNNYNARQRLADDPSTLIWCTAFPTNPNAQPITVPIVGKLTSGNKRPYPTSQVLIDTDTTGRSYSPEVPGPDGMYGTSGEYRYGFRPDGVYVDFYNLETFCTSEPTVFQKEHTIIDIESANKAADNTAQAALAKCRAANPDPSKPCAGAQDAISQVVGRK